MQVLPGMFLLWAVGMPELLIVVLIAIIIFGGKRLGDIGKGLGEGIRNFRSAVKNEKNPDEKTTKPSV